AVGAPPRSLAALGQLRPHQVRRLGERPVPVGVPEADTPPCEIYQEARALDLGVGLGAVEELERTQRALAVFGRGREVPELGRLSRASARPLDGALWSEAGREALVRMECEGAHVRIGLRAEDRAEDLGGCAVQPCAPRWGQAPVDGAAGELVDEGEITHGV